ncbi:MAG: hypothetical protein ACK53L_05620, partial [Pirellulaceae bacterium]
MEINPIEFTPEHQLWVLECLARLDHALDTADDSETTPFGTLWQEPDEFLPCLLLAERICQMEQA